MMRPKEIRRQARITLTGNYFFAVNLNISLTIFTMALTIVLQSTSLGASPLVLNQVLFWVLNLIVLLLNALLTVGLIRYLYSLCRKAPVNQSPYAFWESALQSAPPTQSGRRRLHKNNPHNQSHPFLLYHRSDIRQNDKTEGVLLHTPAQS